MHQADDVVGSYGICYRGAIADVSLDQWPPLYKLPMTKTEIVHHDRAIADGCQRLAGMATDVACSSGDKNTFHEAPWDSWLPKT